MEGTINLPVSIIENSSAVPYRYAVCKYQNLDVESCYEHLHYPDCDKLEKVYRCLVIPVIAAHARGMLFDILCI